MSPNMNLFIPITFLLILITINKSCSQIPNITEHKWDQCQVLKNGTFCFGGKDKNAATAGTKCIKNKSGCFAYLYATVVDGPNQSPATINWYLYTKATEYNVVFYLTKSKQVELKYNVPPKDFAFVPINTIFLTNRVDPVRIRLATKGGDATVLKSGSKDSFEEGPTAKFGKKDWSVHTFTTSSVLKYTDASSVIYSVDVLNDELWPYLIVRDKQTNKLTGEYNFTKALQIFGDIFKVQTTTTEKAKNDNSQLYLIIGGVFAILFFAAVIIAGLILCFQKKKVLSAEKKTEVGTELADKDSESNTHSSAKVSTLFRSDVNSSSSSESGKDAKKNTKKGSKK